MLHRKKRRPSGPVGLALVISLGCYITKSVGTLPRDLHKDMDDLKIIRIREIRL